MFKIKQKKEEIIDRKTDVNTQIIYSLLSINLYLFILINRKFVVLNYFQFHIGIFSYFLKKNN